MKILLMTYRTLDGSEYELHFDERNDRGHGKLFAALQRRAAKNKNGEAFAAHKVLRLRKVRP